MQKKIKGYERYSITCKGEVINTDTGRVLKPDMNNCGYLRITLSKDGETKRFFIHRLMMSTFFLEDRTKEVNHIDGVKTNNHLSNLEYVTSSQNKVHALSKGLRKFGEDYHQSKLMNRQVELICTLLQSGTPSVEVVRLVEGCTKHQVQDIKRRKTWKHISKNYNW